MRLRTVLAAALLVVAAGCGQATWNPDLDTTKPLDRGTPFVEALAKHGCPDSVLAIDSETFTATWERVQIVAFAPFFARRESSKIAYLVRKGKLGAAAPPTVERSSGPGFADSSGPLRTTAGTVGLLPLIAVFLAWKAGRAFRRQARTVRGPLFLLALFLLGLSWRTESAGSSVSGFGPEEGSFAGALVEELGPPSFALALPGDAGSLLAYRTEETRHAIVGGSQSAATQAFLVQRGRIVARSAKTTTLQAQYYLFPFFETQEARVNAAIAWSAALAALALAWTTRKGRRPRGSAPRAPGVESPAKP